MNVTVVKLEVGVCSEQENSCNRHVETGYKKYIFVPFLIWIFYARSLIWLFFICLTAVLLFLHKWFLLFSEIMVAMKKLICGYLKNFKCIETRCKKNISSFYVDLDVAGVVRIYREAVVLECLISHVWLRHLLNLACLHCWFPTPSTSPQSCNLQPS